MHGVSGRETGVGKRESRARAGGSPSRDARSSTHVIRRRRARRDVAPAGARAFDGLFAGGRLLRDERVERLGRGQRGRGRAVGATRATGCEAERQQRRALAALLLLLPQQLFDRPLTLRVQAGRAAAVVGIVPGRGLTRQDQVVLVLHSSRKLGSPAEGNLARGTNLAVGVGSLEAALRVLLEFPISSWHRFTLACPT